MAKAEDGVRVSVWLTERDARRGGRGGGTGGTGGSGGTGGTVGTGGGGGSGPRPPHLDRDRITEVTVRLLDAEGLGGFSMRRLAAELRVTAMSVYWYVDTKDDLLELALDAVHGELDLPDANAPDADWRAQLRALATQYRGLLVRHPWLSPLAGRRYLNIGPRSLAFSRQVRGVMRRADAGVRRVDGPRPRRGQLGAALPGQRQGAEFGPAARGDDHAAGLGHVPDRRDDHGVRPGRQRGRIPHRALPVRLDPQHLRAGSVHHRDDRVRHGPPVPRTDPRGQSHPVLPTRSCATAVRRVIRRGGRG
ncbi:TetR/AcrR family transcriptional regulator [Streptomyces sp. NPDC056716]|uniref:TetR/AcrR family transcriptional regulator n=1 Tax=unclassified Streptomyces TaxID=2593676 RepID=UPI0036BB74D3